jgi:imidazole glycerol-phosphate synthase subunit HisF
MLTKRIIACLDVDAGRVVKGVQFSDLRDAGDPALLALTHGRAGADEVVLLDISATYEQRSPLLDVVRRTARQLFIPFTVGGGIRSLDDAAAVFDAGADKVAVNSAALADPTLIGRIAHRYGSQAVIVAIDALRVSHGNGVSFGVRATGGRDATGRDAVEWAGEAEQSGAGEILLTSIDRDGMRDGFDCELTRAVVNAVNIPVIASGGAGAAGHFVDVFRDGRADAALAASIFHLGVASIGDLKQELQAAGIPMRWPC